MNLSDQEKLILIMLSEIYEHLKIKNGIDAKFVQSSILQREHVGPVLEVSRYLRRKR